MSAYGTIARRRAVLPRRTAPATRNGEGRNRIRWRMVRRPGPAKGRGPRFRGPIKAWTTAGGWPAEPKGKRGVQARRGVLVVTRLGAAGRDMHCRYVRTVRPESPAAKHARHRAYSADRAGTAPFYGCGQGQHPARRQGARGLSSGPLGRVAADLGPRSFGPSPDLGTAKRSGRINSRSKATPFRANPCRRAIF